MNCARFIEVRLAEDEHFITVVTSSAGRQKELATPEDEAALAQIMRDMIRDPELAGTVSEMVDAGTVAPNDLRRLTADVAAKRRILARHSGPHMCPVPQDEDWHQYVAGERVTVVVPCADLRDLAAPYADHPDYLSEWAPDTQSAPKRDARPV